MAGSKSHKKAAQLGCFTGGCWWLRGMCIVPVLQAEGGALDGAASSSLGQLAAPNNAASTALAIEPAGTLLPQLFPHDVTHNE